MTATSFPSNTEKPQKHQKPQFIMLYDIIRLSQKDIREYIDIRDNRESDTLVLQRLTRTGLRQIHGFHSSTKQKF